MITQQTVKLNRGGQWFRVSFGSDMGYPAVEVRAIEFKPIKRLFGGMKIKEITVWWDNTMWADDRVEWAEQKIRSYIDYTDAEVRDRKKIQEFIEKNS